MEAVLKTPKVLLGGIIFILFFFSYSLIARAAINEQIAFYGTLQDTTGTNLAGTYDMVFRFYDAPSGGTLLDTSTHTTANGNAVTVSAGEFRVQLGSGAGNALNGLDFNTANIYIGLTIGSDSEMTPRERLSAAPYAFNTDRLDGYDSLDLLRLNSANTISASTAGTLLSIIQSGAGDILNIFDGGTEVFSILDGGNVGVGTSSPASKFTVAGDARITGALRDSSGDVGSNGMVLLSTVTGTNWVATSSLGITGGGGGSLFTDGGATTYLTATGDNLSIGGTSASEKLSVSGNVNLAGNFGYGINGVRYLYASTSNDSISFGESAGVNFLPDDLFNIAIGYQAAANSTTTPFLLSYNVMIGNQVGYQTSEFNSVMIGSQAGYAAYGDSNIMLGEQAGYGNSGDYNNLLGTLSGYFNTGNYNNLIGAEAGYQNTGNSNDMLGESAGSQNTGSFSVIIGNESGFYNSGSENILIGNTAGGYNAGNENILLGKFSGSENVGSFNEFIGTSAGENNSGNFNQFIGFESGKNAQSTSSVAIGSYALRGGAGIALRQLVNNTVIGYRAGYSSNTGADNNILIGYQAADNLTTGNNNIIIGYNIDSVTTTADNRLNIGNLIFGTGLDGTGTTLSSGNIGIGTTSPMSKFTVAGDIRVTGAFRDSSGDAGSNGMILLSTVTGTNWVATSSLGISGGGGSSLFTDGGTTTYLTATGDNLSIGATSGSERLNVNGSVNITGNGSTLKFDNISILSASSTTLSVALGEGAGASFDSDVYALTAIGYQAGQFASTTDSYESVYIGYRAGRHDAGSTNTFIGSGTGARNIGYVNNFIGYLAGSFNSGNDSTFIGTGAGNYNAGDYNVGIGDNAGGENTGIHNNILGSYAGFFNTGNYNNFFGYRAGYNAVESNTVLIGYNAGYAAAGDSNVSIGYSAGYSSNGYNNNFIGNRAGEGNVGSENVGIGDDAARYMQGTYNIALGTGAGYGNLGDHNLMLGRGAGDGNEGDENILLGLNAGLSNLGSFNNFIGSSVGYVNLGNFNEFIGYETGRYIRSTSTVAIGAGAMRGTANFNAVNNVALGYRAGYISQTAADNNILIGYQAADNLTTGNNNIIIGYNIDNVTATADNRLNIGNLIFGTSLDGTGTTLASGNIGIGTTTPAQKLQVFGNIRVGTTGSNGCLENFGGGVIGGTCSSDERLKENITELASADRNYLDKIVALKPVSYTWNDLAKNLYKKNGEIENIGLIAQSVEEQFPELVSENTEGYRQVDFGALPFYIIEAVKELYAKVTGLEEKVKEIDELKERIERLEAETGTQYTPPPEPEVEEVPAEDALSEEETISEPVAPTQEEPEAPPELEVTQPETVL